MLAVAGAIGASSWLALDLTRPEGGVAIIWIASGLLLGILLTSPYHRWSAYILAALAGCFAAHTAFGDPTIAAAARAIASTLEACIVAFALRHWVGDVSDPEKLSRVSMVAPGASLAACALTALMIAILPLARGTESFALTFAAWFISHLLGLVIVATTFVVVRYRGMLFFVRPEWRWKFIVTMLPIAATTLFVFSQSRYPLLFLIYPPLLLAVFRHHFEGFVTGIAVVSLASIAATLLGYGPLYLITGASTQERFILLQVFIATACLSVLPVVVALSRRSHLQHALAYSEQRVRAIADNLPAVVTHINTQQRYTFANAYGGKIFGIDPASMIGRTMREVRGEELYATLKGHVEAALRGERVSFNGEQNVKGKHYHYQTDFVPDIAADGSVRGFYGMTFDISEQALAQQRLQEIAQHDSLTGLGNRNQFNEHLAQALARCRRSGRSIALVYLDVDHFKRVNDEFGHAIGDAVLCEFARRLQGNIRENDIAVRLGGDEFAVIIEDMIDAGTADVIARKLIAAMHPDIVVDGTRMQITTSIGIGLCLTATNAGNLKLAADNALYRAKVAGRNTYRLAEATEK
ncbi:MAG: diguanylate cyclase [Rhodanobacteraceae bacterium]